MSEETKPLNFIEHIIEEDLANGMSANDLRFRFPPEPWLFTHWSYQSHWYKFWFWRKI